ncbi:histone-lysine N-methyltransferase SUVR5-like [Melia azedarach]|uniref:Histone-lysine N-methyltransferase SUVR5-like n=1 Tax=Melia azedarach TaxID=155640 RepID=A0ACC1XV23_MELAZ|nr:histone-lysine N-methyltransferase SUVR5-like [Melia azedarach]
MVMEVLACSGVQYVGESDAKQSSGTDFVFDGESDSTQHQNQVQLENGKMGDLLNVEGPISDRQGEGHVEGPISERQGEGHVEGPISQRQGEGHVEGPTSERQGEGHVEGPILERQGEGHVEGPTSERQGEGHPEGPILERQGEGHVEGRTSETQGELHVEGPMSERLGEDHVKGPISERQGEGQRMGEELPISGHHSGGSYFDCHMEGQGLSCGSHDFEDDDSNAQNDCIGPCQASENSNLIVDTIESELPSDHREGESSLSDPKWLEHDESVALWVKWRGKWQAGIRCARADWPLSTLKAKPTHDRKKYFVIFFPHTRNYSWADMLLVRSINEFPQPIAYRTHKVGLKMVKDLNVARRYIMQKLAVGMLNIVDQFHSEALMETARNVSVWKEFAMEASRCIGYSDLGRMLLKLQSMILQHYLNSDWLHHSFPSWLQRCQSAHSAESIELLKEELYDSIIWNEVNSLWDAPVQPTLGSEWKTWKHEVMKWFSTSHPLSSGGDAELRSSDGLLTSSPQVSRKRPKLEIRRAEPHTSQFENNDSSQHLTIDIYSEYFNNQDTGNATMFASEISKGGDNEEENAQTGTPTTVADRWDGIVVEAGNSELMQTKDVELTPADRQVKESMAPPNQTKDLALTPVNELVTKKSVELGNRNRQCTAFIESKGRQCVRWANDGDVYCCVHLATRFVGSSAKAEGTLSADTPMCEGTTVLGTRCKHRALYGSSFCKKHRPRNDAERTLNSPDKMLKRKHEETIATTETTSCRDIVLVGEDASPLQVDPVSVVETDSLLGRNSLIEKPEHSGKDYVASEMQHCIGLYSQNSSNSCHETPKRHSLYCDKHLPSWLKRARNGKSRIISKEVFMDLLKDCSSLEQKLHLHLACELFYKLFKSILSLRNPVPMEVQLQWALSEASKDFGIGEFLMKLVCSEKERLIKLWDFAADDNARVSSSVLEESAVLPLAIDGSCEDEKTNKCKICSQVFLNDRELGNHWMDNHKKEAQWLFRGYACAICLDSFTNKKVLESHVQERHHVHFVEQCMLLQCIPCGNHFGNSEELWNHVLSVHGVDFRMSKVVPQHNLTVGDDSQLKTELANSVSVENHSENLGAIRKFICRFCGLKFDLLPDLGRHHQAAHMGPNLVNSRLPKKGIRYYAYKLKSGRLSRPRFKKALGAVSYRIRNRGAASMKKRIQTSKSLVMGEISAPPPVTEAVTLGTLVESQCAIVSKILFPEIQKAKPRPNNLDILSMARLACCKVSLKASLEEKYGLLPENIYLKAAKLCSEHNIQVEWHREGFVCSNGCKIFKDPNWLPPLVPLTSVSVGQQSTDSSGHVDDQWEVDECHYIVDSHHFGQKSLQKCTILCNDISAGQESVPVACVVDESLLDTLCISADWSDNQNSRCSMPWESFTYVTKPLLDQSLDLDRESLQLGCACPSSTCHPETCDHVYLFDNDYEDAKDIEGKPMHGRFPYDQKGRIILEEGYLVYECNNMCRCDRTCPNRVLQNGVQVKLEVFMTESKGWAVRTGQAILRGTFVCEYIGEVLDDQEANKRRSRYGREGCSYVFTVDSHINDMGRLIEGQVRYVIDATKYGNISRFINHSCLPNLVNHQVLMESMDYQRAHIGFYASRDIAAGEELTYDYHYELLPGEGYPCHCGTSKCRGRLY